MKLDIDDIQIIIDGLEMIEKNNAYRSGSLDQIAVHIANVGTIPDDMGSLTQAVDAEVQEQKEKLAILKAILIHYKRLLENKEISGQIDQIIEDLERI